MRLTGLGYVGVQSPEFKAWEELGPDVWGMGLADSGADGTCYLRLDDRHHRIAIHPGERNRLAYIGWEVPWEDDLESAVEDLHRHGIALTEATDAELECRRAERMVHFRAPSGIRHELFYGQEERYKSFVPGRPVSGFVTGDQGLGHLGTAVPDPAAERRFYEDVLGFRLSDIVVIRGVKSYFYHVNKRHHSIGAGGRPGQGVRGLRHVMVQARDIDDVGIALDRAMARDMPITATLGRHSTDRMLSFYVRTPSGFDVECGFGGREVDDATWVVTKTIFPAEVWGHKYQSLPPELEALAALEPAG
jgi:extradiol dioxygenase